MHFNSTDKNPNQTKPDGLDVAPFLIDDTQREDADKISHEALLGDSGVMFIAGR